MMRYEQHSFKTIPLDSTIDAEKERGLAVYEANKHKPIRVLGPMDFSAANSKSNKEKRYGKLEDAANLAKKNLINRCLEILKTRPHTTAELGRELRQSFKSIAFALRESPLVLSEQVRSRGKYPGTQTDGILWTLKVK